MTTVLRWRLADAPINTAWLTPPPAIAGVAAVVGPPGPQGPAGSGGGGAAHLEFAQNSPLAQWVINHNLGYKPHVSVISLAGYEITADVKHVSDIQLQINFAVPTTGKAVIS